MVNLEIGENEGGQRLDRFLRKYLRNAPLGLIYKLIRTKVRVNGQRPVQNLVLNSGDLVSIDISEEEAAEFLDKKPPVSTVTFRNAFGSDKDRLPLNVVYEDGNILVADKPAGLLTHETRDEKYNTLSGRVLEYLIEKGDYNPEKEKIFKPSPANRLDRNTSGLVCFGKNAEASRALATMFRERDSLGRYYLALVYGRLSGSKLLKGTTEKAGKHQYMETEVKAQKSFEAAEGVPCTLVEARLITGRTHQIRKQLAAEGHPIVGDRRYGSSYSGLTLKTGQHKLYLHSWKLAFNHCPRELENLEGQEIVSAPPFGY